MRESSVVCFRQPDGAAQVRGASVHWRVSEVTSSIQSDSKAPSRRALLAGVLGGIGAWAASAVGRNNPVRAADGETVLVGGEYTSTSVTKISNIANGADVLAAASNSGTAIFGIGNVGVFGRGGTWGARGTGTGFGSTGVFGDCENGNGVEGFSQSSSASGVWGHSNGGYGVSGSTSSSAPRSGVWGSNSATGHGVRGTATSGHAIHGEAGSGWAGYFDGKLFVKKFVELAEVGTPSAPGSNKARLFIRDNGNGKTQLCVRFHTGSVRVLATQP
jgi:hypothetical protein